jgi:crossover junction endodeoxyribonuclease RusA
MSWDYEFELPFPPSVNGYWRAVVRGKRVAQIISEKGRDYTKIVDDRMAALNLKNEQLSDRLKVKIIFHPPCKRNRDLDNYFKSTLDAITKCGFWLDDSQIDKLAIDRAEKIKGGKIIVQVSRIDFEFGVAA